MSVYTDNSVRLDLSIVKHDVQKMRFRISTAEQRISDIEDPVHPISANLHSQKQDFKKHALKLGGGIWRTECAGTMCVSLAFQKELKAKILNFLEKWLKSLVGSETLSSLFAIEQAHSVPMRPPPSGAPPRPLLAKLLNFRDEATILHTAHNLPEFKFNGDRISIFPAFSAAV